MKKVLSLLLALMLCLSLAACGGEEEAAPEEEIEAEVEEVVEEPAEEPAEEDAEEPAETVSVYVTIATAGDLILAQEPIDVPAEDGMTTVDAALLAAHEAFYEGEEGYLWEEGDYGPMITRFWGIENGGAYGYYVNNEMAMGLDAALAEGDQLVAYSFKDTETWSDVYTYFDIPAAEVAVDEELVLTMSGVSFDENGAVEILPVEAAIIAVNGEATEIVTDAQGQCHLGFTEPGEYIITAVANAINIVPPTCWVTVQ